MKKLSFLLTVILSVTIFSSISFARGFEAFLNAGSSTIQAGIDMNNKLEQGYMRTGISGIYTNDDHGDYKIIDAHLTLGNEILIQGLDGELGIKGLIGSVDSGWGDRDLGSLAFMVRGTYQLPKKIMPVTTKVFSEISLTPRPMAFMDMDQYFDIKMGVDVYIVENAALEVSYQHYDMKIEDDPRDWSKEDNIVTIGMKLKF